jgi:hypothetical protein
VPALDGAEGAEPTILLTDHAVDREAVAELDARAPDGQQGGQVGDHAGLHVARAARVDPLADDRRVERVGAPPGPVPRRHDIDVALQDQCRYRRLAVMGPDQTPGLLPIRLHAREPWGGAQPVQVHRPEIDVEPACLQVLADDVLDVGLGVRSGDAGHGQQLQQETHEVVLANRGEGSRFGRGQLDQRATPEPQ